jgi:hypothetical protein
MITKSGVYSDFSLAALIYKKRHVWFAKTLVGSDFNNLRSGEISADLL